MWSRLATIILRGRLPILLVLAAITAGMASRIDELGIRYKFGGLLPDDNPALVAYNDFLDQFGEEGNVVALGIEDGRLDSLEVFRAWWALDSVLRSVRVPVDSLRSDGTPWKVHVVDSVFGFRTAVQLVRRDDPKSFVMEPVFARKPADQKTLDSTMASLRNLPFYQGFLHTDGGATIQMVYVNAPLFNSENRGRSVELLVEEVERFEAATGVDVHVSGLPYIRTEVTTKIKRELGLFIALAAIVTALLLLLFFRNPVVMAVCMLVVGTGVVWSLGSIVLFDYKLTGLMGLIPPLMIVIGVPNCIYLLNKYHAEYKRHGNKALALTRMVRKVGNATFMTNATTALGFAAFMFTTSDVLQQFGVIASVCSWHSSFSAPARPAPGSVWPAFAFKLPIASGMPARSRSERRRPARTSVACGSRRDPLRCSDRCGPGERSGGGWGPSPGGRCPAHVRQRVPALSDVPPPTSRRGHSLHKPDGRPRAARRALRRGTSPTATPARHPDPRWGRWSDTSSAPEHCLRRPRSGPPAVGHSPAARDRA